MSGWVCIHRSVLDHKFFSEKPISKGEAWIRLILLACHKEKDEFCINGLYYTAYRGQVCRSQVSLQKEFGWSQNKLRRFLKTLKNERAIDFETNERFTTITICNYRKYQDIVKHNGRPDERANGRPDERATDEQTKDIQQGNNVNNVNNVNNTSTNVDVNTNTSISVNAKQKKPPKEFNGRDCENIFAHWQIVMGHPQSHLLDKRKKLIQKTLDSGYTPIQVKLSIDGHKKSKWHKENGFDGIEYSLKPENIDRFIKLAEMTDAELNRINDKRGIDWDDTTWADGLSAELGVRR